MANPTPTVPAPLALIPYAERFLEGRRVVIFGDATAHLAEEAAERGARLVHVYDPDAARVAQAVATAPKGLSFSVYRDGGDAGLRDGAFDACLIPDLSQFPDPRALLALARKACAAGAVLLAATPRVEGPRGRPGPLNYYDFYAAIKQQFPAIKMVGQVPFQGYALVDFAVDGDLEISVDASLTDGEDREPVAYVAIASDRRITVDPYAIIQLPTEPAAPAAPAAPAPELHRANEARLQAETRLADEQRRTTELGRALSEAGALPRQLEMRLTEEARRAEMLATQLQRAQENNERLLRENRTHQERLQQSAKALAEANAERARLAQREEALNRKIREVEAIPRGVDPAKVEALRKRTDELESEKAALRHHAAEIEAGRAALQHHVAELEAQHRATMHQLAELRTQYSAAHHQNHEHRAQLEAALRQIEELKEHLQQQQQQVAALQTQARRAAALAHEEQSEQVADLSAAETALKERAREIAALRAEVERRGGMVRELLQTLEARGALPIGPQASEHQAHLERELAAARAQLGRVSNLALQRENELKAVQAQIAQSQEQGRALLAAQQEIQALRTALQQERAARAAAEATLGEQNLPDALLEAQQAQDPQV